MRPRICLVFLLGLVMAADDAKDAVKKEMKQLEGSWKVTGFEHNGNRLNVSEWSLVVKGDKYTLTYGNSTEEGTFKIDPSKKPKTVELVPSTGESQGKARRGIYELEGKNAKLCVAVAGKEERPTAFETKPDSDFYLWEFEREK